ncbi:uncharacterized protein METZ01_LOCUS397240, partial [marine metagenome]
STAAWWPLSPSRLAWNTWPSDLMPSSGGVRTRSDGCATAAGTGQPARRWPPRFRRGLSGSTAPRTSGACPMASTRRGLRRPSETWCSAGTGYDSSARCSPR